MENKAAVAGCKILLVDDDIKLIRSIRRYLRKRFDLDTALSGEEGLEFLKGKNSYAVIVSDYRMPDMDGIEFLARAKMLAADSVRILFTGQADLEAAIRAVNEGEVFRFITKSCTLESLAEGITAGIEKYMLQIGIKPKKPSQLDIECKMRQMLLITPAEIDYLLDELDSNNS